MNDIRVRVAATLAAFLSLWLLAGIAVSQSDPSPPVFLRAWGGEGEFLRRANGLALAPDKTIFVANTTLNRITRINRADATMTSWGEGGTEPGQYLLEPASIAMDDAGLLYVADRSPQVEVFSQDGVPVRAWDVPNTTIVSELSIAGNKLFALGDGESRISVFTLDGTFLGSWGQTGTAAGQLDSPIGVAVDETHSFVYITDNGEQRKRVLKFTTGGVFVLEWGGPGDQPGQFLDIHKVAVDSKGRVYVTDRTRNDFQVFTSEGAYLTSYNGARTGEKLRNPRAIVIDRARNDVIVSDDSYVRRYTVNEPPAGSSNTPLVTFDRSWGREAVEYFRPHAIMVGRNGLIYVADRSVPESGGQFQGRIYNQHGALRSIWSFGNNSGVATGLSQDASGDVYAIFPVPHRLRKYTFDGSFNGVMEWQVGGVGTDTSKFNRPLDVANDAAGNVYVADSNNDRVQVFSSEGDYVRTFANPGSGPGQFEMPSSLAFDAADNLYLFEMGGLRVQKFAPDSTFLGEWGGEGSGPGQFGRPPTAIENVRFMFPSLTVTGDRVYVTDPVYRRVQVFDLQGQFIASWGSEGADIGEFEQDMDIAVTPGGNIFVSDSGNSRVHVFNFATRTDDSSARLVANGNMEAASALTGWAYGTQTRGRALATTRITGVVPYGTGGSVMQIGQIVPPENQNQKVAWASQVIYVHPDIENPELVFDYRILTNDILDFASLRLEILDAMGVNSKEVRDYGYSNCSGLNFGQPLDLRWNHMIHDLSPYSGQYIRVQFSIRNAWPNSLGVWAHLDNVTVESGVERPYKVFAPGVPCREVMATR